MHQVCLLIALDRCGLAASVSETHYLYHTGSLLLSLSPVYHLSLLFRYVIRKTVTDLWLFYSHPPKSGDLSSPRRSRNSTPLIHHAASSHDTLHCLAPLLVCSSVTASLHRTPIISSSLHITHCLPISDTPSLLAPSLCRREIRAERQDHSSH